ncbi:MAG: P1 family peptidase [Actinomycetota bacterium]
MQRGRAREHGVAIGWRPAGALNAITDVGGVRVGHRTIVRDDGAVVRTGVTTVFPHEGNPWEAPVYVGTHVLNGYGEIIGINQLTEWGILASPVVLTSSLQIGKAYDATVKWLAGRDREQSADDAVMPIVTECDDSYLSDVLAFPLTDADVWAALDAAATGPVEEGCVGSGTGMQCFDYKGGIGTSSRVIDEAAGAYTVGALVMTNYGDRPELRIDGVRVGRELTDLMPGENPEGSCVVVVATDAPLLPHQLRRLAQRAALGLARTGSTANNGSGELMLAFSTATQLPHPERAREIDIRAVVDGPAWNTVGAFSELFAATVEAVEEAVVNALFAAETTTGRDGSILHAMPIDRVLEILAAHG